jgi:glycosyltransferase involved in cell wall biosynthesis
MADTKSLAVIVPVYNERHLVQGSLDRLRVLGDSPLLNRVQVIVVDDASSDQTPLALEHLQQRLELEPWGPKFQWTFLRHLRNRGKGAAIRTALEHADAELVAIHDSDLEYHPRDLLRMIPLFIEEGADAVFGSRFLVGEFHRVLFFRHYLGNRFLTFLCNLVSDLNLTDMETCYKMVQTRLLRSIPLESDDFRIEPELTIKLAKRGARIFEVPIRYSGRTYAEGKKINWRDGVKAMVAIGKFAVSDRIYAPDEYGSHVLGRLNRVPRLTRWMADVIRPYVGERVLELGAGTGLLTRHLVPRTEFVVGDVNPLHLDALGRMARSMPYLRVLPVDLARAETFPRGEKFDTVISLNGIERVADDVAALCNLREALAEGGAAVVLVPQSPGLFGSLDRVLGHQRRYTESQLLAAGERAGLRARRVIRFNRVSTPGWWLSARLLRRSKFALVQLELLNLLIPLVRRVDHWLPLPPLSLIAIFERAPAATNGAMIPSNDYASPAQPVASSAQR